MFYFMIVQKFKLGYVMIKISISKTIKEMKEIIQLDLLYTKQTL